MSRMAWSGVVPSFAAVFGKFQTNCGQSIMQLPHFAASERGAGLYILEERALQRALSVCLVDVQRLGFCTVRQAMHTNWGG